MSADGGGMVTGVLMDSADYKRFESAVPKPRALVAFADLRSELSLTALANDPVARVANEARTRYGWTENEWLLFISVNALRELRALRQEREQDRARQLAEMQTRLQAETAQRQMLEKNDHSLPAQGTT